MWKLNTSVKAMRIAMIKRKYTAILSAVPAVSLKGKCAGATPTARKKTVSFAAQQKCRTCFIVDGDVPGSEVRNNIDEMIEIEYDSENTESYRQIPEFDQASSDYVPGAHAAETEWWDSSHNKNHVIADIFNLKLFVTKSQNEFRRDAEADGGHPGNFQGIVGLNR